MTALGKPVKRKPKFRVGQRVVCNDRKIVRIEAVIRGMKSGYWYQHSTHYISMERTLQEVSHDRK